MTFTGGAEADPAELGLWKAEHAETKSTESRTHLIEQMAGCKLDLQNSISQLGPRAYDQTNKINKISIKCIC